MRKFFVRLFNLIYLAGAAVSIWALVTQPLVSAEVGVDLSSDEVANRLYDLIKGKSGSGGGSEGGESEGGESEEESGGEELGASGYRLVYRESSATEDNITKEDIKDSFPDGLQIAVQVKIETKDVFNIKNKELLKSSIAKNLEESVNGAVDKVSTGLRNLILTVAERTAKEELAKQINAQINQYFEGATPVTEQQVQDVYDNVKTTINQEGDVTVEKLADTIVGEADPETGEYPKGTLLYILEEKKKETQSGLIYVAADPQPSVTDVQEDIEKADEDRIYYVEHIIDDPETEVVEKEYILPTEYTLDTTYFIQKYDVSTVSGADIAEKLAQSLETIPGLVEDKISPVTITQEEFDATVKSSIYYYSPEGINAKNFVLGGVFESRTYCTIVEASEQPSQADIEGELEQAAVNRSYVVKTAEGYAFPDEYVEGTTYYTLTYVDITEEQYNETIASTKYKVKTAEDTYEFAKAFEEGETYYIETRIVNDVDTALSKLIEAMLGGNDSEEKDKRHLRVDGEPEPEPAPEPEPTPESETEGESSDDLKEVIKKYVYTLIPMEKINGFAEKADQYSEYVALGVLAFFIFPWALFALITIVRTFRKTKCWTKPWVVIVFAFIQFILGFFLTFGLQESIPLVAQYVPQVKQVLDTVGLTVNVTTSAFFPSYIYVGFIILLIPYMMFAHRLKVQWKLEKRDRLMKKYEGRRRMYEERRRQREERLNQ